MVRAAGNPNCRVAVAGSRRGWRVTVAGRWVAHRRCAFGHERFAASEGIRLPEMQRRRSRVIGSGSCPLDSQGPVRRTSSGGLDSVGLEVSKWSSGGSRRSLREPIGAGRVRQEPLRLGFLDSRHQWTRCESFFVKTANRSVRSQCWDAEAAGRVGWQASDKPDYTAADATDTACPHRWCAGDGKPMVSRQAN